MGAGNRNEYRQELIAFGNWCVRNHRLLNNPFNEVPKADAKADPRRSRFVATSPPIWGAGRREGRRRPAEVALRLAG